jgi:hypothetical protein
MNMRDQHRIRPQLIRRRDPIMLLAACFMLMVACGLAMSQDKGTAGYSGEGSYQQESYRLRFSVSPTAEWNHWANSLGLKDAVTYGGRLGMDLGDYAGLDAYFMGNPTVKTQLGDTGLRDSALGSLGNQDVRLLAYGANLTMDVTHSLPVVPYLKAGGGILDFHPKTGGDNSRAVQFQLGGGVRYEIVPGRLQVEARAADELFRFNRYSLAVPASGAFPADPDAGKLRNNLNLGGALSLQFGLGGPNEQLGYGQSNHGLFGSPRISFPVEPFFGTMRFSNGTGLRRDTNVLGGRAGVNIGELLSFKGYYWNGMKDVFGPSRNIQSWGGEAQFNIPTEMGLAPYVVGGVGQLNFMSGYADRSGARPKDQLMLIGGAGVGYSFLQNVRVQASVRDNLLSASSLASPDSASKVYSNLLYTIGFSYAIGGPQPY